MGGPLFMFRVRVVTGNYTNVSPSLPLSFSPSIPLSLSPSLSLSRI